MKNQLKFMMSFIEDLLNLKMIKDNVMTLASQDFKPHKVITFLKELFEIKAESKGVSIEYQITDDLYVPAKSGKISFSDRIRRCGSLESA